MVGWLGREEKESSSSKTKLILENYQTPKHKKNSKHETNPPAHTTHPSSSPAIRHHIKIQKRCHSLHTTPPLKPALPHRVTVLPSLAVDVLAEVGGHKLRVQVLRPRSVLREHREGVTASGGNSSHIRGCRLIVRALDRGRQFWQLAGHRRRELDVVPLGGGTRKATQSHTVAHSHIHRSHTQSQSHSHSHTQAHTRANKHMNSPQRGRMHRVQSVTHTYTHTNCKPLQYDLHHDLHHDLHYDTTNYKRCPTIANGYLGSVQLER